MPFTTHNTQHTTHDIRQIHAKDLEITDKDKYCYLMTYSFPCTDLSVAGKMKGMSKEDWQNGNSTRSGLLWEVERILKEMTKEELPDILLMENVPQVHAEQNKADFDNWCNFLRSKGYINHWQDLNAKNYGIPQNRDRCFMVSILSDNFIDFNFPKPVKLEKVMKDFLEETVDEKYYIKNEKAQKLIKDLIANGTLRTEQNRTSVPYETDFVNNRLCKRQSKISSSVSNNRLCKPTACGRLQRARKLCENECSYREPIYFRGFRGKTLKPTAKKIDIAVTITTKDDIQNLGTNGVIEWCNNNS